MRNFDRSPGDPVPNLEIGQIIEVDGSHVVAELDTGITELSRVYAGDTYPIGQFGSLVKIHFGRRIIYGYVGRLRMRAEFEKERGIATTGSADERVVELDIFGEGEWIRRDSGGGHKWELQFERGVSTYPLPLQKLYLTPKEELQVIYAQGKGDLIEIGEHVGSGGAICYAEVNELLGKHTAVLGSTGAGKSGTVAAVLHQLLEMGSGRADARWHPRIVILDPHDEYSAAFSERAKLAPDDGSLSLPYWMLDLQETIALLIGKTEFLATSQANIVKNALLRSRETGAKVCGISGDRITADSPIPYALGDPTGLDLFGKKEGVSQLDGFVGEVNRQRPPGSDKKAHEDYHKILRKLETLVADPRMRFMMKPWDGRSDPFADVARQLLGEGSPLRIVDLSGVPNEVAGAACSAIARTLFNVKLWQTQAEREADPVLLVCEEAHRYVPDRGEAMYAAAQEAIRRVAKEGRKYGIGLLLVSQRPGEVEATVLSQCNTWIVHRITNETDRNHVRAVLPDSLAGLAKVLSALRRREVVFVGQAAMLPSRVLIRSLERDKLPCSHDIDFVKGWQTDPATDEHLQEVAGRWRAQGA